MPQPIVLSADLTTEFSFARSEVDTRPNHTVIELQSETLNDRAIKLNQNSFTHTKLFLFSKEI